MIRTQTPLPAPCEGTRAGGQTPGLADPATAGPGVGPATRAPGAGGEQAPAPGARPTNEASGPPTVAGMPGQDRPLTSPLTPDDIHRVIADAYTPWQVSLVLAGHEEWGADQMRPPSGGSADTRPDGVRVIRENSPYGMHTHLISFSGGELAWERAGIIAWARAERLIREVATPATTRALLRATSRERNLRRAGQYDPATPTGQAAQRAWAAIIGRAGLPVQDELFAGVGT